MKIKEYVEKIRLLSLEVDMLKEKDWERLQLTFDYDDKKIEYLKKREINRIATIESIRTKIKQIEDTDVAETRIIDHKIRSMIDSKLK